MTIPVVAYAAPFPEPSPFWNVAVNYEPKSSDTAIEFSQELQIKSDEIRERLVTGFKAASIAGRAIRQVVVDDKGEIKKTIKADGTVVTQGDIAASKTIQQIVRGCFPKDGFISEEESYTGEELKTSYTWVVDPIDGTEAFAKKQNDWGIHIALLQNQKVVMGINYYPTADTTYFAVKNAGAYRVTESAVSKLGINKSTIPLKTLRKPTDKLMKSVHEQLSIAKIWSGKDEVISSVGLRYMYIADGNPAFIIIDPRRCWERCGIYDFASSDIILREAGIDCTDCDGNPLQYFDIKLHNGVLVAPSTAISQQIIEIYQKALRSN